MLKIKYLTLLSLVILLCGCNSNFNKYDIIEIDKSIDNNDKVVSSDVDENLLLNNIKEISLTPRVSGTEGELRASKFLSEELKSYGYNIEVQDFPIYKQDILQLDSDYMNLNPDESRLLVYGKNIIAKSGSFDENKKSIYITAHYDSDPNTIGVIDNATGVSSVMEIARILRNKELPFNVQIIFFSAEESSIYGSRYFVINLPEDEKNNIMGVINIDMVGEKNAGDIVIQTGQGRNNIISKMINYNDRFNVLVGATSDEYSFYRTKIPSITLSNENSKTFEGENQFDNLDIKELSSISKLVVDFISEFNESEYFEIINDKMYNDIEISKEESEKIYGYKLISKQELLLKEAYDSAIIYKYTDDNDKEYTLTESDSRFIDSKEYKDFKILDSENNFMYKVQNNPVDGEAKLYYKWGYTFGELKSNESLDNCLNFLDTYYINYYENIFGEKPKYLILDNVN